MGILKKICNKKFIGILLAVVILFNVISPNIVTPKAYAIDAAGILLFPLTFLVSMLAEGALTIVSEVADITGVDRLFVDSVVFNKIPIFQVNIFDPNLSSDSAFKMGSGEMLQSIQKWYYITRTIAIAASFVILVYVAIKILISTAAGDKAKYKSLLKDWLLSLLLIFAMHFIMAGILFATDALTDAIAKIADPNYGSNVANSTIYDHLLNKALAAEKYSLIYAIMIWVLIVVTFAFIIIYAKRVVMIAFLTVFAPLVALSYSIDKIKDGRSQILDKWMKEYIYTALMMPLDAMLYAVLSDTLMACLNGGNIIFGLALVIGYLPLRGWFNEFLGTDKAGHGMAGVAAGAVMGNAISKMASGGSKGKSGGKSTSNESGASDGGNAIEGGSGKGAGHEIETKASPNPLLAGGADKGKVSSPTSAAAAVAASNSSEALSAGQRAVQARQDRKANLSSTLGAVAKGSAQLAGKAYGKGLGMVAGATAGLAMTALTGNAAAGIGTGIGMTKAANSGNAYGLGGKAAAGTANAAIKTGKAATAAAIGAKDIAVGLGSEINNMRDMAMVGGLVNAMAENGSMQDIEDDEEREEAYKWASMNTTDERFEELYNQVESGEISAEQMDDIMLQEAISNNKGEIKQSLANQRMETRVNRKTEYKENAKAAGQAVLADGYSNKDAKETERAARKRGREDFKAANARDNSVMAAKRKEIRERGKK